MNTKKSTRSNKTYSSEVKELVKSQAFKDAWAVTGSSGIGSLVAHRYVKGLIIHESFTRERLNMTVNRMVDEISRWADAVSDEDNIEVYEVQLGNLITLLQRELLGTASVFLITGALTASLAYAKAYGLTPEEVSEAQPETVKQS